MEHGSRTRLMTALVLVVVFGSGLMIGLAADGTLSARPAEEVAEQAPGEPDGAPNDEPRSRGRYMYEQVDPTEAQMTLIDSIVREYRQEMRVLNDEFEPRYDALNGEFRPRYNALVDGARESIKTVLTPEQAAKYQQLIEERDRRRSERDERNDRD